MNTTNNNRILKNTIILFVSLFITKLIGAALKIPLTNIIGGLGMGYFSTAQSLFSPIYAVTAAALPTVVMRMTAQNAAAGRFKDVRRLRRAGLFAAFGLGFTGSVGMLAVAKPFAHTIAGSPDSYLPILIIAPSLFFCSISAVYKGYYEGLSNMIPTAVSQIIEAVVKSTAGVALAMLSMSYGGSAAYTAAAAIAGITIAEFFGLVFLVIRGRFGKDGVTENDLNAAPPPQRKRVLIKTLMHESLPLTIAALAMNLNPFIDMMTIPTAINAAVASNRNFFLQNYTYGAHGGEALEHIGNFVYGSYTGIAVPIFALVTTVTALVSKSALPEISAAWERQDSARLQQALHGLFKGTFIVGLPISLGMAALAHPILSLLYFSKPAEVLISTTPLVVLGAGGAALLMAGTLFAIFVGIGRTDLQIKLMLMGAVIKLGGNAALVRIPQIGATGAAIATVACYTFVSIVGLIMLRGCLKPEKTLSNIRLTRLIVQPFIFAAKCATTAYFCYFYVFDPLDNSWYSVGVENAFMRLVMSVTAGAIVYLSATMFIDRAYIKDISRNRQIGSFRS